MESLHSKKITSSATTASTHKLLDILEIKEDVVVLKNGSLRSVLAISAINYDLKSSEEQEAIIAQFQNFLNSLDFPLQILISSRKINMEKYMEFLEGKEKELNNDLLSLQISEYKKFIEHMVSVSNIMEKNFYVIIPFAPIENDQKGFLGNLANLINPRKSILEKREVFETHRNQLFQRVDHIIAGLSGIGLRLVPLQTQELIELMYNSYNPDTFRMSGIGDVGKIDLN